MTRESSAVAAQAAAAAPGLAGMLAEGAITDTPVPVHMLESVMAGPFGKNVFPTAARDHGATLFFARPIFFAGMPRAGRPPS